MDIDTDDEVLQTLAEGKSMDYEQWPSLLTRLLTRLEKIVQEDIFPPLKLPTPSPQHIPSSPPSPTQDESSTQSTFAPEPSNPSDPSSNLPARLQTLLSSITTTLSSPFKTHPPHTIQRLAELLLHPNQHHRTLPSYLHALDRVVHVSSGAHIFPLPPAISDPSSLSLLSNGTPVDPLSISWGNPASTPTSSTTSNSALGSDESLGGALLTPIAWLTKPSGGGAGSGSGSGSRGSPLEGEVRSESTERTDGPNGPGGVETVSVSVNGISSSTAALRAEGGITQGELLRQEQKAGVVPASQLREHRAVGDKNGRGEEDDPPHARGPDEIGSIDMGPQSGSRTRVLRMGMQGIDVEAAMGRRLTSREDDEDESEDEEKSSSPKREADEELDRAVKRPRSISVDPEKLSLEEREDVEVEMVDADGKTEEEEAKVGEKGKTKGPDAVDSTAV